MKTQTPAQIAARLVRVAGPVRALELARSMAISRYPLRIKVAYMAAARLIEVWL